MTSLLIVDDEPAVRDVIARWAASCGLKPHSVASAEDALATLRVQPCDLAIVDVLMPGRDGFWLLERLQREHPQLAIVLATAYANLLEGDPSRLGYADLLVKPFHRERFQLAVERGIYWRRDALADQRWIAQLNLEVDEVADELARDLERRIARQGLDAIRALDALSIERIPRTAAHSERVARYVAAMTRELSLPTAEAELVDLAARFHDVGKAAMPMALLTKPCALTDGEVTIMRRHVDVGANLLAMLPAAADAAPLVRASHEWFGGNGYPYRLAGADIPLGSRLIAVADAYDAITQHRAYRRSVESTRAVNELLRCCPSQFDPALVDLFLHILSRH